MTTPPSLHSVGTGDSSLRATVNPPANLSGEPGAGLKLLRLTRVAKQFEGVLLTSLLQEVQKGTLDPSDAGLGAGSETLRSLGTEAVAQALAQRGGLGIARMIINHYQRYLADGGS
jgi:hypothetical protein